MADKGALEVVLGELTTALAPIVIAAEGQPQPDGLIRLALEIGVDLSMLSPAQGTAFATSVSGVYNDLTTLIENPDGFAEHIPEALDHIEKGTTLCNAEQSHLYSVFVVLDSKVMFECFAAMALLALGHPDQSARTRSIDRRTDPRISD